MKKNANLKILGVSLYISKKVPQSCFDPNIFFIMVFILFLLLNIFQLKVMINLDGISLFPINNNSIQYPTIETPQINFP
jgi:hypothetical protein